MIRTCRSLDRRRLHKIMSRCRSDHGLAQTADSAGVRFGLLKVTVGWSRCLSMPQAPRPSGSWIVPDLARALCGKVVRSPDLPQRIFMRTRRSSARPNLGGRMRAQSRLSGPCFEPLISDRAPIALFCTPYPWLSVHRRRLRSQSRSDCCLSRASAKTGCCRGPFRLALRKEPQASVRLSRIGHPFGNPRRAGLTGRPPAGVPSDLRCSCMRFLERR
jgi:hypothetical protein